VNICLHHVVLETWVVFGGLGFLLWFLVISSETDLVFLVLGFSRGFGMAPHFCLYCFVIYLKHLGRDTAYDCYWLKWEATWDCCQYSNVFAY